MVIALISAHGCFRPELASPDFVKSPRPQDFVRSEQLPANYDPYFYLF